MAVRKFKNLEEIEQYLNKETQVALEETLMAMIPKLRFFIDEDVYYAYHPTFYKRTRWLKRREDVIEHYISNLQNKIRGGIRIVASRLDAVSDREKFQHGASYRTKSGKLNTYSVLSAENFLEILNDEDFDCLFNPFGLPSLQRSSFWKDFLEWAKDHYAEIFKEKCRKHKIDLNNLGSTKNADEQEAPKGNIPSPEPPDTSVTGTSSEWKPVTNEIKKSIERKSKGITFEFGIHKYSSSLSSQINNSQYYNSTEIIEH